MSLPSPNNLTIIAKIWQLVEKQAFSVIVMAFMLYVNHQMVEQNMRQMRIENKECNKYNRDVLQGLVEASIKASEKQIETNREVVEEMKIQRSN